MKYMIISFLCFVSSVQADNLSVGRKVDIDLNIFSDKDLGLFSRGIKEDCTFLGKEDGMYVFQYDGDKMMLPINSIKRIILK